jgi:hypothetical protein
MGVPLATQRALNHIVKFTLMLTNELDSGQIGGLPPPVDALVIVEPFTSLTVIHGNLRG